MATLEKTNEKAQADDTKIAIIPDTKKEEKSIAILPDDNKEDKKSTALNHLDGSEIDAFELKDVSTSMDERNQCYSKMVSTDDLVKYHKEWFEQFIPVEPKKKSLFGKDKDQSPEAPVKPRTYIYSHYDATPSKDLIECLPYFIDMHTFGFIPVEWQFACNRKTKSGKTLLRRSFLTGFLRKELVPILKYLFGTHNEIDFWEAGSPFELFFAPQPLAADNLRAVSQMDAVSSPERQGIRGADHCVQMTGPCYVRRCFPEWTSYVNLAHFLQDKNPELFMNVCRNMVIVHYIDKKWQNTKSLFEIVSKILRKMNDPAQCSPIKVAIQMAHDEQIKYGLSQRIHAITIDSSLSLSKLMGKPIEKLKMMYVDESQRVAINGMDPSRNLAMALPARSVPLENKALPTIVEEAEEKKE